MKLYLIKTKKMGLEDIDRPDGLVTEEQILDEIEDAIAWAPDKIHFIKRTRSSLIDVMVWESLAYRINMNMYRKLMENDKKDWGNYPFRNL